MFGVSETQGIKHTFLINIYTIDIHYCWLFPFSFSYSVYLFRSNGLNSDISEKWVPALVSFCCVFLMGYQRNII